MRDRSINRFAPYRGKRRGAGAGGAGRKRPPAKVGRRRSQQRGSGTKAGKSTSRRVYGRVVPVTDQDKGGGLWRHRDFMLLWSGQTVSEMGSAVTQLALPLTAVVILKASTLDVGLLTAAATLAFALIALPAGALVDRRPKRGIMIACR